MTPEQEAEAWSKSGEGRGWCVMHAVTIGGFEELGKYGPTVVPGIGLYEGPTLVRFLRDDWPKRFTESEAASRVTE